MNALMNIRVQVLSTAARAQLRQLEGDLTRLRASQGGAGAAAAGMTRGGISALSKWGNQVQWAGRQLQYNFTLPIMLAGGAAAKFALDNDKAFTRVQKVYGDASMSQKQMRSETDALRKSFELLSSEFGVNQADVINIAADWAAAGASGVALAKATKLTIETMILGEMDAAKSTQSLIAIQAQYGMTVDQLSKTIDTLNMVENQTGTSMSGLIDAMVRSAGVARQYGVDVQHLAAMTAAITPAAGSAAQAGNGLKTILTRLMVPTSQAAELMAKMGINTNSAGWQSLTATQRLEAMAKSFDKLSNAQQAQVGKAAAGVYQINRFGILMQDIINKNGYYQKALKSSGSESANFAQRQRELNQVLSSSPQKLQIIWNLLKNSMADIIQPMIPLLLALAHGVQWLVTGFSNLNPGLQKLVGVGLLVLAMIGPLARYVGSVTVLFGLLSEATKFLGVRLAFAASGLFTLAAAPFRMIATGLGAVAGAMMTLLSRLGSTAVFGAIRTLFVTTFASLLAIIQAAMGGMGASLAAGGAAALLGFARVMYSGLLSIITRVALLTGVPLTSAMLANLMRMPTMIGPMLANLYAMIAGALGQMVTLASRFAVTFVQPIIGALYSLVASMATASLGLWATMQSIWITGAARVQVVMGFFWTRMLAAGVLTRTGLVLLFTTLGGQLASIWTKIATALSTIWATGMQLLTAVYNAAASALVMVTTTLGGWLTQAWAAAGVMITTAWEATLAAMRIAWVATIAFMGSPALIMRMVLSVVSKIALIVPLLEGLLPALAAVGGFIMIALTSPWTYAILAILGIAYSFRDKIATIWNSVVSAFTGNAGAIAGAFAPLGNFFNNLINTIERAFFRLPEGVQSAFLAVVRIVEAAAMKVYDLFSYLNPFAHHSPSLVENVTRGLAAINAQFANLPASIGGPLLAAYNDLKRFKDLAGSLGKGQFDQQLQDIAKVAPQMVPAFNVLLGDLDKLNQKLNLQGNLVNNQQLVVDKWKNALDAANASLTTEQNKLDAAQKKLDSLNASYQAHQDALNNFANAPIQGMKAMNDQIFANSQAQKQLQLQMLQWEQVNGPIADITNHMASLAGDIEKLKGDAANLRQAGAGSDILGPINDQITAMQKQYDALNNTAQSSPIGDLQKQLDALQQQGQILDLTNSLTFDPLKKQIDDLMNSTKELTFQQIIDGITKEQAAMSALQPQIDKQTKAVNDQKDAVDRATAARDAISSRYDAESKKLDILKNQYDAINQGIQDITQSLNEMGQAASAALAKAAKEDKLSAAFDAAAAGNFPDVGGQNQIGREGSAADQTKQIEDFNKQLAGETANMFGKFNMFGPLKDMWNKTWSWIDRNVGPSVGHLRTAIAKTWNNLGDIFKGSGDNGFVKGAASDFQTIEDIARTVFNAIITIVKLFAPDLKKIFAEIVDAGKKIWTQIGPEVGRLGTALSQLFVVLWPVIKLLAEIIGVTLLFAIKIVASVIANTLGPVLNAIIGIISGVIRILSGLIEFVTGVLSGNWALAWKGIEDVFIGTWNTILAVIVGFGAIVWGIVKGIVEGIVGFFQWLYDVLVGHSIVPDLIDSIVYFFNLLAAPVKIALQLMWAGIQWVWNNIAKPMWDGIKAYISAWATIFTWVYDHIIGPAVQAWWAGALWVWNNIARPMWEGIKLNDQGWAAIFQWVYDHIIGPAFQAWWSGVQWIWNNVAKPIWEGVKTYFSAWAAIFGEIYTKIIKPAWDALWNGLSAAWVKVGKPLFDRISSSIKSIMNGAIDAVNFLIRGINKVAGLIHIDIGISEIPKFASGGQIPFSGVGSGFKTNGPRAIVGEGNNAYPEYVIPTDPRYRSRAQALWSAAGGDLKLLAGGGILGGLEDFGGKIISGGKKLARGAAAAAFIPFKNLADAGLDHLPVDWVRGIGKNLVNRVYNWIKGVSDSGLDVGVSQGSPEQHARAVVDAARKMNLGQQGSIIGLITGLVESGLRNYANSNIPESLLIPHDAVGSDHFSAGIMQQQTGPFGDYWGSTAQVMNPSYAATRFFKEMLNKDPGWKSETPGSVAQSVQVSAFPDRYQQQVPTATALLKSIGGYAMGGRLPAFANGGITNRPTAGVFGEAGREVLAPLTPLWSRLDRIEARQQERLQPSRGGDTTEMHFHGDLSFPNVRSGQDAEDFLKHLKGLG